MYIDQFCQILLFSDVLFRYVSSYFLNCKITWFRVYIENISPKGSTYCIVSSIEIVSIAVYTRRKSGSHLCAGYVESHSGYHNGALNLLKISQNHNIDYRSNGLDKFIDFFVPNQNLHFFIVFIEIRDLKVALNLTRVTIACHSI